MKSWQCIVCGFVYNEADGLPSEGIAAGTRRPPDSAGEAAALRARLNERGAEGRC